MESPQVRAIAHQGVDEIMDPVTSVESIHAHHARRYASLDPWNGHTGEPKPASSPESAEQSRIRMDRAHAL
jgi:hypothetical protein